MTGVMYTYTEPQFWLHGIILIHIDMVKTISCIDGMKGLHTNYRLASCFVSYANEHLSDYHGIAWFMLFVLLVLCAVNPLLIGGFPYTRSIVQNCFRIAVPVCAVSICSQWILFTKEARLWRLLSCLCKRGVEQIMEMQVSRKLMKLKLCYCYVICHSVIDAVAGPVCGETTVTSEFPLQGITGVALSWSSVCHSIAGGFPSQKVGLMFSFMFAWASCLTNSRVASELKSNDAYAMSLLLSIRHFAWLNYEIISKV